MGTARRAERTAAQAAESGPVKTLGLPVKFSRTPGMVRTGAPLYGEHTREILSEHGFSGEEIDTFVREGAVTAA